METNSWAIEKCSDKNSFATQFFRFHFSVWGRKAWKKTGQPPKKYQNMEWTRYSSEEMRHKEVVDDAMSSWGDSYQVPPLKPPQKNMHLVVKLDCGDLSGQVPYAILVELFLIRILRYLNVSWILHLHLHPGILVLWNCRSNFLASSSSRFRALFPQFRPRHGTCYAVHRGCGLDPHGNLALPVTVLFMDGNAMVQSYTTVIHEFHIS